jgi:CheY-like chemotaxis protein
MEQVIVNLAVNARDAMPGGGTLRIETRNAEVAAAAPAAPASVPPGQYLLLTVSDTGQGMDPQTLARIFEPFFTTKAEGKGTGLGLSTVYGIIQQSGGQIVVESARGSHTTFGIYLPRQEAAELPATTPPHPSPAAGAGETVLVVEDSEGVRRLVTQVLRQAGHLVLEASSGEEALRVAARHEGAIHLLLADVVMPGLNGRETAERLLAARPGLRVLYMSGYNEDAVLAAGVRQAPAALLDKPFTPLELLRKVREALAGG